MRGHWHALLTVAANRAGVPIECIDHAAPEPLTDLWAREDLAAAFMCGYPLATRYPGVRPLAAPVTAIADGDAASYRSVWLVRAEQRFRHACFDLRPPYRLDWSSTRTPDSSRRGMRCSPTRPRRGSSCIASRSDRWDIRAARSRRSPTRASMSPRSTPTGGTCCRGTIATLAARFRAIGSTAGAPMPPLVCAAPLPDESARRLISALLALGEEPEAKPHLDALGIRRFAAVTREDYAPLAQALP